MMRSALRPRGIARTLLLFCALSGLAAAMPAIAVRAEETAQRVVQGKVLDKGDAALKGAIVYLKDDHTLSVKSYISAEDGTYRFGQLTANTDYELWAEVEGKKSPVKTISSFDTRTSFTINLKVDTSK